MLDVTTSGEYARVFDPDRVSGLGNIGAFELRTRLDLGKNPTYCAGLDGEIGGSDRGAVYGVTAYPIGVGGRWGAGSTISLCGGSGLDGVVGAVPLGARFPAELSIATSLGPIRPILWARPSWIAGAGVVTPAQGSSTSFVERRSALGFARANRARSTATGPEANAGGGFAFGGRLPRFAGHAAPGAGPPRHRPRVEARWAPDWLDSNGRSPSASSSSLSSRRARARRRL